MKRILLPLAVALVVASCGNAASRSVNELDSFVDKVEEKCDGYSEKDWEKINEEFEALVDKTTENYEQMTPEERSEAMKAIGRYSGLYAKKGLQTAADAFKSALDALQPFTEGFSSAFDSDGD